MLDSRFSTLDAGSRRAERFKLNPDLADELRKSKFLIVQGNFVRLLKSYGEIMFFKGVNGKSRLICPNYGYTQSHFEI